MSLSGFTAPTLKLILPHLYLSQPFFLPLTAPLSLRLHFSFCLMRFSNLSHSVCWLSACHCSFARSEIWGVCVVWQSVHCLRLRQPIRLMFIVQHVYLRDKIHHCCCCLLVFLRFAFHCWIKWKVLVKLIENYCNLVITDTAYYLNSLWVNSNFCLDKNMCEISVILKFIW